eukprot:TRINITY_DN2227_c0_g1_i1.p1 TRINITY_DN2227_c0_g1~~TRINITY_DN2227_c0_g1_i1.p1  ORF type:complete len:547 (-),score=137.47 TRINITY_DN2227_c0_g1_i1:785-2425(-)
MEHNSDGAKAFSFGAGLVEATSAQRWRLSSAAVVDVQAHMARRTASPTIRERLADPEKEQERRQRRRQQLRHQVALSSSAVNRMSSTGDTPQRRHTVNAPVATARPSALDGDAAAGITWRSKPSPRRRISAPEQSSATHNRGTAKDGGRQAASADFAAGGSGSGGSSGGSGDLAARWRGALAAMVAADAEEEGEGGAPEGAAGEQRQSFERMAKGFTRRVSSALLTAIGSPEEEEPPTTTPVTDSLPVCLPLGASLLVKRDPVSNEVTARALCGHSAGVMSSVEDLMHRYSTSWAGADPAAVPPPLQHIVAHAVATADHNKFSLVFVMCASDVQGGYEALEAELRAACDLPLAFIFVGMTGPVSEDFTGLQALHLHMQHLKESEAIRRNNFNFSLLYSWPALVVAVDRLVSQQSTARAFKDTDREDLALTRQLLQQVLSGCGFSAVDIAAALQHAPAALHAPLIQEDLSKVFHQINSLLLTSAVETVMQACETQLLSFMKDAESLSDFNPPPKPAAAWESTTGLSWYDRMTSVMCCGSGTPYDDSL